MHFLSRSRDLTCAALVLSAWALYAIRAWWGQWPLDLTALYMAGRFVSSGDIAAVYGAPEGFFSNRYDPRWLAELAALGRSGEVALPYVYPPIWAWLTAPLTRFDPMDFFNVGRCILFSAQALTVWLMWRMARPTILPAVVYAIIAVFLMQGTIPFVFAAMLGQPQMLLMLLIVLAFERYSAGAWRVAAIALGLAAAIKVTPILLAAVFLAERDLRTPALTLLVAAATAGLSFAIAGPDPHLAFLGRVGELNGLVPLIGLNVNFAAVMQALMPYSAETAGHVNPLVREAVGWVSVLSKLGLMVAIGAALTAGRSLPRHERLMMRMILTMLATLLFGPLSWLHYFMLPVLALPLLPGIVGLRTGLTCGVSVGALLCLPVAAPLIAQTHAPTLYQILCWGAFFGVFVVLRLALPPGHRREADLATEQAIPAG